HAVVIGVPTRDPGGSIRLTPGLGRPLVLSTLETAEAMRILAADGPRRPWLAAVALACGLVGLALGLAWALLGAVTGNVLAASPEATTGAGDPRSSGQGPGLVGDPLFAIGAMLAIGIVAAVLTLGWVRSTGGRRG
ncbi:MAG: hypothetical protein ACRDIL_10165, partial [Candidatus Limnocylindrales bacterium]